MVRSGGQPFTDKTSQGGSAKSWRSRFFCCFVVRNPTWEEGVSQKLLPQPYKGGGGSKKGQMGTWRNWWMIPKLWLTYEGVKRLCPILQLEVVPDLVVEDVGENGPFDRTAHSQQGCPDDKGQEGADLGVLLNATHPEGLRGQSGRWHQMDPYTNCAVIFACLSNTRPSTRTRSPSQMFHVVCHEPRYIILFNKYYQHKLRCGSLYIG